MAYVLQTVHIAQRGDHQLRFRPWPGRKGRLLPALLRNAPMAVYNSLCRTSNHNHPCYPSPHLPDRSPPTRICLHMPKNHTMREWWCQHLERVDMFLHLHEWIYRFAMLDTGGCGLYDDRDSRTIVGEERDNGQ